MIIGAPPRWPLFIFRDEEFDLPPGGIVMTIETQVGPTRVSSVYCLTQREIDNTYNAQNLIDSIRKHLHTRLTQTVEGLET